MKVYLSNAFSLTMIKEFPVVLGIKEIELKRAKYILQYGFISAVGHEETAKILSEKLGIEVPFNRISITIEFGDILIVAQLMGERKPFKEMTREEIEKYPIKFFEISIIE